MSAIYRYINEEWAHTDLLDRWRGTDELRFDEVLMTHLVDPSGGPTAPVVTSTMSQPLIVKAKYEKEIRILPVYTDELSFDELYLMISRMFKGHIAAGDDLILKYVDSDGDLITLSDAADLDLALLENKKLCVHVSSRPQEDSEHPSTNEPFENEGNPITSLEGIVLIDELTVVRSQINNLIDKLATCRPVKTTSTKYKDVAVQETFAAPPDPPATTTLQPIAKTQAPPLPSRTSLFATDPVLDPQRPAPLPPLSSYSAPGPFHSVTNPSLQPTYYVSQPQQQQQQPFSNQYGGVYIQGVQTSSSFQPPPPPSAPSTWMTGNPAFQYQMQSAPMAPPPPRPQTGFPGQQHPLQHHSGSYPRQRGYQ
ncbi:hypothetical protein SprV_0301304600 [Sparganum proliferum]